VNRIPDFTFYSLAQFVDDFVAARAHDFNKDQQVWQRAANGSMILENFPEADFRLVNRVRAAYKDFLTLWKDADPMYSRFASLICAISSRNFTMRSLTGFCMTVGYCNFAYSALACFRMGCRSLAAAKRFPAQ